MEDEVFLKAKDKVLKMAKRKLKTAKLDGDYLPEISIDDLTKALIKHKLSDKELETLTIKIIKLYEQSKVEAGEPIGVVAAQSISESATQMTMRTFHNAGVAELNVTLGLPRLIQLIDLKHKSKKTNDLITIFVDKDYIEAEKEKEEDKEKNVELEYVNRLAKSLPKLVINDLLSKLEFNFAEYKVEAVIDSQKLFNNHINKNEFDNILKEIDKRFKKLIVEKKYVENPFFSEENIEKIRLNEFNFESVEEYLHEDLHLVFQPPLQSIRELRSLSDKFKDFHIRGYKGIEKAIIRKEEEEWIIYVQLFKDNKVSFLNDILEIDGVDIKRTTSNSILEIEEVLGIEAARNAIIKSLQETLEGQGLVVDVRHIMLLADIRTFTGELKSIGSAGISGYKSSVLARASFERTVPNLLNASIRGEEDNLRGFTENIIVGQPIPIGTGSVDVVMKSNKMKGGR